MKDDPHWLDLLRKDAEACGHPQGRPGEVSRDVAALLGEEQGGAPGHANGKTEPKNQKKKRKTKTKKGATSNEVRMGTFLKSFAIRQ